MEEGSKHREDLYSKAVRAGKRTYFFDVKATRGNDLYMTITESKRRYSDDGKFYYEKHKLFLYKEDFEKFREGLEDAVDKISELRASGNYSEESPMDRKEEGDFASDEATAEDSTSEFTDVKFEDLDE
jgi:hypothetical protein